MDKYKSKNHSKFLIFYHIIFVCKYRQKLLIQYGDEMKQILRTISDKYDFSIRDMEVDKDHIHFMIKSVPKLSPLQIVRVLKQQSTIEIWKRHPQEMKKYFWHSNDKTFWSDGYFVSSIGNVSQEMLKKYIENQG